MPRNKYVEIRTDKPANQKQRDWPEYKTCKFTAEAIVTEGTEKGEKKRICANPDCPIHHARKQRPTNDAAFKVEQEKRRREEVIAQTTSLRVLKAIGDAIPIRLMKRDLLFVVERLAAALDERRIAILLRLHGVGKATRNRFLLIYGILQNNEGVVHVKADRIHPLETAAIAIASQDFH